MEVVGVSAERLWLVWGVGEWGCVVLREFKGVEVGAREFREANSVNKKGLTALKKKDYLK